MHIRSSLVILWTTLACLVQASGARAEPTPARWLASELALAERALVHPKSTLSGSVGHAPYVALMAQASSVEVASAAAPSLARERGRFRTMQTAGYLLAAASLALTLAAIPLAIERNRELEEVGSMTCAKDVFPYVAAPMFAAGIALGVTGTLRGRRFVMAHGDVAPIRTPWRVALAGVGVGLSMAGLASALAVGQFCNS